MSCPHNNFRASCSVARIVKEENKHLGDDAPVEVFAMEISVICAECEQPFQFDWTQIANPDIVPLGTQGMRERPWTAFDRSMLGVSISPMKDGGRVEPFGEVQGHA